MEYPKEPPEDEAASASFRQLMPQSVSINPDLLALPVTGAEGPEANATVLTGDLPISREALLSSRQQKPLFSHTPGRRALHIRQLQHHQTGQPDLSETNVSICHKNHAFQAEIEKGWLGAQEALNASDTKTRSGWEHMVDNTEHCGNATPVGGSVPRDPTNYISGTSNFAAGASKPKSATTGPASYTCGEIVSHHAILNLPEDPFAPSPYKIKSSQSFLPAQPTYSCLPTNSSIAMPPPLKAPLPTERSLSFNEAPVTMLPLPTAPPPSKRSLPFTATPVSEPPAYTSPPAFADSPMITTPHGISLNPAFKAHAYPNIFSTGYQPYANFQTSGTVWHAPVHAPLPRAQTGIPNHHTYSQASSYAGHASHHIQSHAEAHVVHKPAMRPVAVSHPQCDSTASLRRAAYGSSARCPLGTTPCSRSQDSSRVYADMPKSELADEPAEIAASTPAGDSKNDATISQAQKLSSWCHVKHSRGETPELSRDQVKALVQAQIEAGKPMRTAWYRGSEHSSGPSIASTESAVSIKAKAFVQPSIVSESNNSVSSDAPSLSQAGTGSAGQRVSTGVFQPTTF